VPSYGELSRISRIKPDQAFGPDGRIWINTGVPLSANPQYAAPHLAIRTLPEPSSTRQMPTGVARAAPAVATRIANAVMLRFKMFSYRENIERRLSLRYSCNAFASYLIFGVSFEGASEST
jgi:hypothetical protein